MRPMSAWNGQARSAKPAHSLTPSKRASTGSTSATTQALELALLKEMVLPLVRIWFVYAEPLHDDDPGASANAEIGFQEFLEILSRRR